MIWFKKKEEQIWLRKLVGSSADVTSAVFPTYFLPRLEIEGVLLPKGDSPGDDRVASVLFRPFASRLRPARLSSPAMIGNHGKRNSSITQGPGGDFTVIEYSCPGTKSEHARVCNGQ